METISVRDAIVSKLTDGTDYSLVPGEECKDFVNSTVKVDHRISLDIEKNTRAQSKNGTIRENVG